MELMEVELERNPALWDPEATSKSFSSTVSERRIMITHAVGQAWNWLHEFHSHNIIKAFRQCGISIAANGSQDVDIEIRGIDSQLISLAGWETGGLHCNLDSTGCTGSGGVNLSDGPEVDEYLDYLGSEQADSSRLYFSADNI
ncbi:hypothetical protein DFH27DRAFT_562081 [Peziza echinospora]|nr:hypothetical protein DFH27DRAFT_562081 [Peziza echinospora]